MCLQVPGNTGKGPTSDGAGAPARRPVLCTESTCQFLVRKQVFAHTFLHTYTLQHSTNTHKSPSACRRTASQPRSLPDPRKGHDSCHRDGQSGEMRDREETGDTDGGRDRDRAKKALLRPWGDQLRSGHFGQAQGPQKVKGPTPKAVGPGLCPHPGRSQCNDPGPVALWGDADPDAMWRPGSHLSLHPSLPASGPVGPEVSEHSPVPPP